MRRTMGVSCLAGLLFVALMLPTPTVRADAPRPAARSLRTALHDLAQAIRVDRCVALPPVAVTTAPEDARGQVAASPVARAMRPGSATPWLEAARPGRPVVRPMLVKSRDGKVPGIGLRWGF